MKKMRVFAMLCVLLGASGGVAPAEEAADTLAVEVTGLNVNMIETFCGGDAPVADAVFSGLNVLIVENLKTADGQNVEEMSGKPLHYLPVAASSGLISGKEYAGKKVTVKGKLYREARVIKVVEFEINEGGEDWDFEESPAHSFSGVAVI